MTAHDDMERNTHLDSMTISPKARVLIGQALRELLDENSADLDEFIRAYALSSLSFAGSYDYREEDTAEYYKRVVLDEQDQWLANRNATEIFEAMFDDCRSAAPVALKQRWYTAPGRTPALPKPVSQILRQLDVDGYCVESDKVRAIDSEAPKEREDQTRLVAELRRHPELKPETLVHHIEESDSSAAAGNWHAAAGEARALLDGVVVNVAVATAQRLGKPIPNFPTPGKKRSKFGPARQFLNDIKFIDDAENALIAQVFSYASETGGHPNVTSGESAKLVRRICWVAAHYLIQKYSDFNVSE